MCDAVLNALHTTTEMYPTVIADLGILSKGLGLLGNSLEAGLDSLLCLAQDLLAEVYHIHTVAGLSSYLEWRSKPFSQHLQCMYILNL